MRFHRRYPLFQCWASRPDAAEIIRAENLAVARFEPTTSAVQGGAVLDLIFAANGRLAILPFIDVDGAMLIARENTPLVWPEQCSTLGPQTLDEIARRIEPWLEALTMARQANREVVRRFSDAIDESTFEAVRSASFLGAASYANALHTWAPYVYASRFSDNRRVGIRDPDAATGAALLARRSAGVRADLGSADLNRLATTWFGLPTFGEVDPRCDVGISARGLAPFNAPITLTLDECASGLREVQVAHAIPTDVMLSFDPDDSAVGGTFGVRVTDFTPARQWSGGTELPVVGGSSGKILLLLRENWKALPDADVDEARALASRLRSEGFYVEIASASAIGHAHASYDLVHAFTLPHAAPLLPALERFAARGTPIVTTAGLPTSSEEAVSGPALMRVVLNRSRDETTLGEYLRLLELRRLKSDELSAVSGRFGAYAEQAQAVLRLSNVVIASCAAEEAVLREELGFSGEIIRNAPYVPEPAMEPVDELVGSGEFILVHAPVEWRSNLPLLVREAAARDLRVVVAGPAVEGDAYRIAREFGGDRFVHLPLPSDGEVAGLYRRARLFADVSWAPAGLYRAAFALASGCRVLVSKASRAAEVWPEIAQADPCSARELASALSAAWDAPAPSYRSDPAQAFLTTISAYAQAQQQRAAVPKMTPD
jgi:hypothetical protein